MDAPHGSAATAGARLGFPKDRESIPPGVGCGRTDANLDPFGRRRREAERRGERRAVGVHVAARSARLARRGVFDAGIRQIQGVAAARAEACAIRRARARLRAPCGAAREAGVAGIRGGIAGGAGAALTADDALRSHASDEHVQEVDAVGSLALAPRDARRYAVAVLFAAREVLAVDVVLACRERRAATGVGAPSALGIEGADGAPGCSGPRVGARPSSTPTDDGRDGTAGLEARAITEV